MQTIPIADVRIGDRIRWGYNGDCDFGTVSKINKKTFRCESTNKFDNQPVLVEKALVFEALRNEN